MSWRAISYRFLVKPDPIQKTTESGIIIHTDEKVERNAGTTGVIVDIGEDSFVAYKTKTQFAGLKIGDRIVYAKYSGMWLPDLKTRNPDNELLALNDGDIVGVWREDDA